MIMRLATVMCCGQCINIVVLVCIILGGGANGQYNVIVP